MEDIDRCGYPGVRRYMEDIDRCGYPGVRRYTEGELMVQSESSSKSKLGMIECGHRMDG